MNTLKLVILGTLVSFAASLSAHAMPAEQVGIAQLVEPTSDPPPIGSAQLPPDLSEPLEVDQQQVEEFFAPAQQQSVEAQAVPFASPENLIEPPPGTQTPGQLTPERRLSLPIQ